MVSLVEYLVQELPEGSGKFIEQAHELATSFGLHDKFFDSLSRESNDWTFILKVDSLLETASKSLLEEKISIDGNNEEFIKLFKHLKVEGSFSILELLKLTDFPNEGLNFIRKVRELRNLYAHNICDVERSLLDMIASTKQPANFTKVLLSEESSIDELQEKFRESEIKPNYHIMVKTFAVLSMVYLHKEERSNASN